MLGLLLAALLIQQPEPFDSAAFSLPLPAGMQASENGNGSYHFTELRRVSRAEDQADPSLKLVVLPGGGGFDAASLTAALVADFTPRLTAAGFTAAGQAEVVVRVAGADRKGVQVTWSMDGAARWIFEAVAWTDAMGNTVGLTMKTGADARAAERAELQAALDGLEALPFDAETGRIVRIGGFALPVPAVARVESQEANLEAILAASTTQGRILGHWGYTTLYDGPSAAARQLLKQETDLRQLAAQSGAEFLKTEGIVLPWGDRLAAGCSYRLRLADGSDYEMRSVALVQPSELLLLAVEMTDATRAVQEARLEAILAASPPAGPAPRMTVGAGPCTWPVLDPLIGEWRTDGNAHRLRLTPPWFAEETGAAFFLEAWPDASESAEQAARRLAAAELPGAEVTSVEESTCAWLGAEQPSVRLRLARGAEQWVLHGTLASQAGSQCFVALACRTNLEDMLVESWRALAAGGLLWEGVEGGPCLVDETWQLLAPAGWTLQAWDSDDGQSAVMQGDGCRLDLTRRQAYEFADFESQASFARAGFEAAIPDGEEAPGYFQTTRLLGYAPAAVCGGRDASGALRRHYAVRDAEAGIAVSVTEPAGAAPEVRARVDRILELLVLEAGWDGSQFVRAGGIELFVPAGFRVDETCYRDSSILDMRPFASDDLLLSLLIYERQDEGDAAAELEYKIAEARTGYLKHYPAPKVAEYTLDLAGTEHPMVRLTGRGAEGRADREILVAAVSVGEFLVSVKASGLTPLTEESMATLISVLGALRPAPLIVHVGDEKAGFSFDRNGLRLTGAETDAAGAFLLRAASGEELRLEFAAEEWSFSPPLAGLQDATLAAAGASAYAAAAVGALKEWSGATLHARIPVAGALTEGEADWLWQNDAWGASVQARWWTGVTGSLDLHETLRNLATPTPGVEPSARWRVRRTLAGLITDGAARLVSAGGGSPEEELHVYAVRWRGNDLVVNAVLRRDDDGRGRAAVEAILGSLRFHGQPLAPGLLVQGERAALLMPWDAGFDYSQDGTRERWEVGLAGGQAAWMLTVGPDTEEERAVHQADFDGLVGGPLDAGAAIGLDFGFGPVDGQSWRAGWELHWFQFSRNGSWVSWMSAYVEEPADPALLAQEEAAAASMRIE